MREVNGKILFEQMFELHDKIMRATDQTEYIKLTEELKHLEMTDYEVIRTIIPDHKIKIKERQYAMYKGEDILAMGTIKEISEETGKNYDTVRFYTQPAYKKRCKPWDNKIEMVWLRDNDEEDEE